MVDQYADRIIEIERGKIIKDEQVHTKSIHQPLAIENKKKTLLKQILFIFQYIKARSMEFLFKTMIAVSYTHLDVYKRQCIKCNINNHYKYNSTLRYNSIL